jgi:hypothetical protein
MTETLECPSCEENKWSLVWEREYPEILICTCCNCNYVTTYYLEDE